MPEDVLQGRIWADQWLDKIRSWGLDEDDCSKLAKDDRLPAEAQEWAREAHRHIVAHDEYVNRLEKHFAKAVYGDA